MRSQSYLAGAVLLLAVAACFVPSVDLSGKACDSEHRCAEGYLCQSGLCVVPTSDAGTTTNPDAGVSSDAGEPTCSGNAISCEDGKRVACEDGSKVVLEDCGAAGRTCDERFGCISPCGLEGLCAAGESCDEAINYCIPKPVCAGDAGCAGGSSCTSGACLPASSAASVTLLDGGIASAEIDCYPVAAGVPGPEVTLRGFLVSASGTSTPRTIGYSLALYREAAFVVGDPPFTTVVVGSSDNGAGTQVGSFNVASVPTDVPLVAASAGEGGMPTYHYFRVSSGLAVGGVVDRFNLVSHEEELWDALVSAAGVEPQLGRAGIDGQVFDCRSPSRRVAGATAALDVASRAFYTLPGLVAIDSSAGATANNGRFFFFDVPVMSQQLVVGIGPGLAETRSLRTEADSVTVITIAP